MVGRVTLEDLLRLRRARDLIDRDSAKPLDVPALARFPLMSPGHFSRSFLAAFGETVLKNPSGTRSSGVREHPAQAST